MSDLYTSQVHLKRLLAGQATPAFTPAPEATRNVLDPGLFPGLGALNEDEHGRLQCPVRGCGEWHNILGNHMTRKHKAIGGPAAIKKALALPASQSLTSRATRKRLAARPGMSERAQLLNGGRQIANRRGGTARGIRHSVGANNRHDTCPAQLQEKIESLARELGRSPSQAEFSAKYGPGLRPAIDRVFGSWRNAKLVCGLESAHSTKKYSRQAVLAALGEYVKMNGDLPTAGEANCPWRSPVIPRYATILRALGVETWDAAMRTVIESLDIVSARYGRPRKMA